MSIFDFDDRGRAHVTQYEFEEYLEKTCEEGDYQRERDGVVYYFNSFGCKLAEYNISEQYGMTF